MLPVDRIFVLNLDRRQDRWEFVSRQFEAVGLSAVRISAIDGNSPEFRRRHWYDEEIHATFRSPGALACLMSHITILQRAVLHGYRRIAVFEDDVLLHRNFTQEIARLDALPDWKVVYLGASQTQWDGVVPSDVPGFYHPDKTYGSWAMLLDESMFGPLLQQYQSLMATTDKALVAALTGRRDVFVASPNICICDVRDSDIRSQVPKKFIDNCRWDPTQYESPRTLLQGLR